MKKENEPALAPLRRPTAGARAAAAARRRGQAPAARRGAPRTGPPSKVVRVQERLYLFNWMPLGAGQFQNGERAKGTAIAAGQIVLGLVNLAAIVVHNQLADDRTRTCISGQPGCSSPPYSDSDRTLIGNVDAVKYVVGGALLGAVRLRRLGRPPELRPHRRDRDRRPASPGGSLKLEWTFWGLRGDADREGPGRRRARGGAREADHQRRARRGERRRGARSRPCPRPRSTSTSTGRTTTRRRTRRRHDRERQAARAPGGSAPGDRIRVGATELFFDPAPRAAAPAPPADRPAAPRARHAGPLLGAAARGHRPGPAARRAAGRAARGDPRRQGVPDPPRGRRDERPRRAQRRPRDHRGRGGPGLGLDHPAAWWRPGGRSSSPTRCTTPSGRAPPRW